MPASPLPSAKPRPPPAARSPAPGYPDDERTVIDCIAVVMDEEIEHYRFAIRDLTVLEAS